MWDNRGEMQEEYLAFDVQISISGFALSDHQLHHYAFDQNQNENVFDREH